jgi:hypothetical protein
MKAITISIPFVLGHIVSVPAFQSPHHLRLFISQLFSRKIVRRHSFRIAAASASEPIAHIVAILLAVTQPPAFRCSRLGEEKQQICQIFTIVTQLPYQFTTFSTQHFPFAPFLADITTSDPHLHRHQKPDLTLAVPSTMRGSFCRRCCACFTGSAQISALQLSFRTTAQTLQERCHASS